VKLRPGKPGLSLRWKREDPEKRKLERIANFIEMRSRILDAVPIPDRLTVLPASAELLASAFARRKSHTPR
jgi:hypothetical protein